MDETIELFDVISISAGVRGLQILLAPADYLHATNGKVGRIGTAKEIVAAGSSFAVGIASSHRVGGSIRLISSKHAPIRIARRTETV